MARADAGLTISELAQRAGVSRDTISHAEKGQHSLQATTLHKIARALGKTPSELLAEEERLAPKVERRSSLEPTLFNGLEEERRSSIIGQAVSDAADKWHAAASNPNSSPYEISAVVDAALGLGEELAGQFGEPSDAEYSPEQWEVLRLAARLLEIAKAGNERIKDAGQEELYRARREQIKEWTQRLSA